MRAFNVRELPLLEGGFSNDPSVRGRFNFPIHAGTGASACMAIYFEVDPGQLAPPHVHTAEEILYVSGGKAEVTVGEETVIVDEGGLVWIPALVHHGVRNVGDQVGRYVGFFAAAAMETTFDEELFPLGSRVLVVPAPEEVLAATYGVERT